MWKIQIREVDVEGNLGPWKDMRFTLPFASEQDAFLAAASLDQDGILDEMFVRVVQAA